MTGIGPTADDRHHRICNITFIDIERRPRKERCHSTAQQHRSHHSVQHKEHTICLLSQQVTRLRLKLIADRLQHESKQDYHPQPIGTAEARAVKQRKRCKKSTAKRYERSERKLPFTPRRVDYHFALLFRLAQTEYQRIATLHEQQENKYSAQQGYYKPPVLLKKYIGIHVNYKLWIVNYEL